MFFFTMKEALRSVSDTDQAKNALSLIQVYVNNIVKDPVNLKYRKIRISKLFKRFDVYKVNYYPLSMGFKTPLLKNTLRITPYLNSGLLIFMPAMQVSMITGTPSSTYELL